MFNIFSYLNFLSWNLCYILFLFFFPSLIIWTFAFSLKIAFALLLFYFLYYILFSCVSFFIFFLYLTIFYQRGWCYSSVRSTSICRLPKCSTEVYRAPLFISVSHFQNTWPAHIKGNNSRSIRLVQK